jgi:uncharacterized protein YegL
MRQELTDITLVVDRSGSMHVCQSDAEGGVNSFIEDQKKAEGEAVLTLVQFDTEYEFVHTATPINDVPPYHLVPRGSTALLDAVGRSISEAGARLDKMPEDQRPGCVVFVIVTDGHENASKEFRRDAVRMMITSQQSEYNWQFTFLGADATAFDEAVSLGIRKESTAVFDSKDKSANAYQAASANVSRMRLCTARGQTVNSSYTKEERSDME